MGSFPGNELALAKTKSVSLSYTIKHNTYSRHTAAGGWCKNLFWGLLNSFKNPFLETNIGR